MKAPICSILLLTTKEVSFPSWEAATVTITCLPSRIVYADEPCFCCYLP